MAGICCGVVGEGETTAPIELSSRPSRRRRMDLVPLKLMADVAAPQPLETDKKRQKLCLNTTSSLPSQVVENCKCVEEENEEKKKTNKNEALHTNQPANSSESSKPVEVRNNEEAVQECLKFGVTSVCGRRREMEDAVSVHPSVSNNFHFFGVFDGHGCSHVAMRCRDRLHDIVKEEVESVTDGMEWKDTMEKSFDRMDKEVQEWRVPIKTTNCRCDVQTPQCDAVGSTAVVAIVTPEKIIVSNCGDSRAVLCRNGVAFPLSSDHKPDRPDELVRIQDAGGRVIYWDGARVLGVLAMSRAIGDNYLKPYVISEPEVTITDRTAEDECLILASDGLWDVVSNETACGVARMCLRAQKPSSPPRSPGNDMAVGAASESSDKACSDASILLTKLALARHSTDNVSVVVVDLRRNHQQ
ncbi:protein phpsphatase 2C (PP2C) [Fagus crenata]